MGSLLFRNEACLVINKLPGESSEFPQIEAAGEVKYFSVHRLDTPVSGCLLMAKDAASAAFLGGAFACQNGKVEKRYWAIVEKPAKETNTPPEEEILVHWISEDRKANKSYAFTFAEASAKGIFGNKAHHSEKRLTRPKKAALRYKFIGEGARYLFMEIELITGRHHQIRSQLAALGLHIKGDLKYGARRSEKTGGIRLHAWELVFPNPLNPAETIHVQAEPPVMDALWMAFIEQKEQPANN